MALTAPERESGMADKAMSVEDAFEAFDAAAPVGWRVELIEGEIHVVPPAFGEHEEIVAELSTQTAERRKRSELRTYTGVGLDVPGSPTGKVVPDVIIAPKGSYVDREQYHDPSAALLVGEVTSESTADADRGAKLRGYALAGIPVYLLLDRLRDEVIVYSEPEGEKYGRQESAKFSKVIALPEPLGFDLDTSEF
ncbi:Uma2 family endonuclease [Streptomyces sp. ODS28]|uniref:Uma2 family endonuclease n=1 Tax=Streptomyces sp. ODS28 TaxID=3136688 RepID=UPI0031E9DE18